MNFAAFIARLKLSEGWRSHAYIDTRGNITIGYGHNLGRLNLPPGFEYDGLLRPVNGITQEIGTALLVGDAMDAIERLRKVCPWWEGLDDIRQQVLADMAFNLGVPGLLKWPVFLSQVERREFKAAAMNMLGTPWRRQVGERAVRLAYMMEHGKEK